MADPLAGIRARIDTFIAPPAAGDAAAAADAPLQEKVQTAATLLFSLRALNNEETRADITALTARVVDHMAEMSPERHLADLALGRAELIEAQSRLTAIYQHKGGQVSPLIIRQTAQICQNRLDAVLGRVREIEEALGAVEERVADAAGSAGITPADSRKQAALDLRRDILAFSTSSPMHILAEEAYVVRPPFGRPTERIRGVHQGAITARPPFSNRNGGNSCCVQATSSAMLMYACHRAGVPPEGKLLTTSMNLATQRYAEILAGLSERTEAALAALDPTDPDYANDLRVYQGMQRQLRGVINLSPREVLPFSRGVRAVMTPPEHAAGQEQPYVVEHLKDPTDATGQKHIHRILNAIAKNHGRTDDVVPEGTRRGAIVTVGGSTFSIFAVHEGDRVRYQICDTHGSTGSSLHTSPRSKSKTPYASAFITPMMDEEAAAATLARMYSRGTTWQANMISFDDSVPGLMDGLPEEVAEGDAFDLEADVASVEVAVNGVLSDVWKPVARAFPRVVKVVDPAARAPRLEYTQEAAFDEVFRGWCGSMRTDLHLSSVETNARLVVARDLRPLVEAGITSDADERAFLRDVTTPGSVRTMPSHFKAAFGRLSDASSHEAMIGRYGLVKRLIGSIQIGDIPPGMDAATRAEVEANREALREAIEDVQRLQADSFPTVEAYQRALINRLTGGDEIGEDQSIEGLLRTLVDEQGVSCDVQYHSLPNFAQGLSEAMALSGMPSAAVEFTALDKQVFGPLDTKPQVETANAILVAKLATALETVTVTADEALPAAGDAAAEDRNSLRDKAREAIANIGAAKLARFPSIKHFKNYIATRVEILRAARDLISLDRIPLANQPVVEELFDDGLSIAFLHAREAAIKPIAARADFLGDRIPPGYVTRYEASAMTIRKIIGTQMADAGSDFIAQVVADNVVAPADRARFADAVREYDALKQAGRPLEELAARFAVVEEVTSTLRRPPVLRTHTKGVALTIARALSPVVSGMPDITRIDGGALYERYATLGLSKDAAKALENGATDEGLSLPTYILLTLYQHRSEIGLRDDQFNVKRLKLMITRDRCLEYLVIRDRVFTAREEQRRMTAASAAAAGGLDPTVARRHKQHIDDLRAQAARHHGAILRELSSTSDLEAEYLAKEAGVKALLDTQGVRMRAAYDTLMRTNPRATSRDKEEAASACTAALLAEGIDTHGLDSKSLTLLWASDTRKTDERGALLPLTQCVSSMATMFVAVNGMADE